MSGFTSDEDSSWAKVAKTKGFAPPDFATLVDDLFDEKQHALIGSPRVSLLHKCFDDLNAWTTEADILAFLSDAGKLNSFTSRVFDTISKFVEKVSHYEEYKSSLVLVSKCMGCNTPYDNGGHEHPGITRKAPLNGVFGETVTAYALTIKVHQITCLLNGMISILNFKTSDPAFVDRKDALFNVIIDGDPQFLIGLPPFMLEAFGEHIPSILTCLIGLIDNCYIMFPFTAHLSAALLSLVVSSRPSLALPNLDAEPLIASVRDYLGDIFRRVSNAHCMVEEYFGITQLLNVIPLLYFMGDWSDSNAMLQQYHIPAAVATLAINVLHSSQRTNARETIDSPLACHLHPVLESAIVFVKDLYGKEGAALIHMAPLSFTCVALVEMLARWQVRCGLDVANSQIPTSTGPESVHNSIREYVPTWQELVQRTPELAFIMPVVNAFATPPSKRNKETQLEQPEVGVLRGPLLHASMKCAYRGCHVYEGLKHCGGGCRGLARYCCPEHQKKDWSRHKRFCRRFDAPSSSKKDDKKKKKKKEQGQQQQRGGK